MYRTWNSLILLALLLANSAAAQDKVPPLSEQSIYIPYDKLEETFEKQGRGVFVPYERFQELWKAARDKQPRPVDVTPPVKAMITEIESLAQVEQNVVRVRALAKIDLLDQGWLTVSLRLADAAVLSATIDDQPARLIPEENGGQALLVKKDDKTPEQIVLRLVYAKSFTKAPGQNTVSFQAPLAPVNRWRIRVPQRGVKVNVHPMLAATEVPDSAARKKVAEDDSDHGGSDDGQTGDKEDDETVVLAFVGAAPEVRIDWTPKAEGASGLDALVSVQSEQQITIDEGITRTQTQLTYEVSRSELSQLSIEVPADHRVVNVLDANVRQWDVEPVDTVQRITVDLFQPARDKQQVVVELEKFRDDEDTTEITAPMVKAVSVGRQRGVVVVSLAAGLRAEPIRRTGLSQVDSRDIPLRLSRLPALFSYRYAALPIDLALRVEKVQPRIYVDQLVEAFLEPRQLTVCLLATIDIQRAGVFELECEIPTGFELRDVRGHEGPELQPVSIESYTLGGQGDTQLTINLGSKATGKVGLAIELQRDLDEPSLLTPTDEVATLALFPPRVRVEAAARSTGRFVVYAPEALRVSSANLQGLRGISFEEAFRDLASACKDRFPELRPTLAFAFSAGPVSAQLEARRRQPQVTCRQLLVARITPAVVKYEATFHHEIRYSGVESLRIDVPATIADRINNETTSMRKATIDPPPEDLEEGYVALSFTGDTELLGAQILKLNWEEDIEDLGIGRSVDLTVPRLKPAAVDRADGQIVLVKAETIDVGPKGEATSLDPIDPQHDLIAGVSIPDAAAALEFRDDAWDLTLTATRYRLEEVKRTSIEQAVIRMVITRSDRIAVQALYRMRSNRQRLEVALPGEVASGQIEFDTDPLRINDQTVTLERGDQPGTFHIPLVGFATNEPFLLELRFTMPGDGHQIGYPTFPGEPAVQRVSLVTYLPEQRAYIGRHGPWTEEMDWRFGDFFQRRFVPRKNIDQLIKDLQKGINVSGDPSTDFPVDGKPLLFSTLRPDPPDVGALRLTTVPHRLLDGLVLGGFALLGVTLLARPYIDRLVVVCLVVAVMVLAGVFWPALAGQTIDQTLFVAALLVALLWFAVSTLRLAPKLADMRSRQKSETVAAQPPPIAGGDVAGDVESTQQGDSRVEQRQRRTP